MPVLVDTGYLFALADADDSWHERVVHYQKAQADLLLVPVTVLPEICHLLRKLLGPPTEERFVQSLVEGHLPVESLLPQDMRRIAVILRGQPEIGFVDASIVAMAERMRVMTIATTDRRHFSAVRPAHCPAFHLVP